MLPVAFYGHVVFYRTTDGGSDWLPTTPIKNSSFALGPWSFAGPLNGFVAVGPALYRTANGGERWTRVPGQGLSRMTQLDFIDGSRGWAISDGNLFQTSDGGTKWLSVPLRITDIHVSSSIGASQAARRTFVPPEVGGS